MKCLDEVRRGTSKMKTIGALVDVGACLKAIDWARASKAKTAQELWSDCPRGDWLEWLCEKIGDPKATKLMGDFTQAIEHEDCFPYLLSPLAREAVIAKAILATYESPWLV